MTNFHSAICMRQNALFFIFIYSISGRLHIFKSEYRLPECTKHGTWIWKYLLAQRRPATVYSCLVDCSICWLAIAVGFHSTPKIRQLLNRGIPGITSIFITELLKSHRIIKHGWPETSITGLFCETKLTLWYTIGMSIAQTNRLCVLIMSHIISVIALGSWNAISF